MWFEFCFVFIFFFFKQKTAYEMRISDWSSDVCSSDLFGSVVSIAEISPGSQTSRSPACDAALTQVSVASSNREIACARRFERCRRLPAGRTGPTKTVRNDDV